MSAHAELPRRSLRSRAVLACLVSVGLGSTPSAQDDGADLRAALRAAAAVGQGSPGNGDRARTLDDRHVPRVPSTRAAWRDRAERLRRRVAVSTGLFGDDATEPPRFVERRRVLRDDYAVDAVAFEVLPGYWASASLYRPLPLDDDVRRPVVLSPHGHWNGGRFQSRADGEVRAELESGRESSEVAARHALQARCVAFVRAGLVVLHYDMPGFAEHLQLDHGDGFGDAEALGWGLSRAGLQTLASRRALDLVVGLPYVDPERIGVTGASGGGTQTFLLCAVDERPLASAPVNMVSGTMQGGCVCENVAHLRVGTDNVELAALHAPRPQLIVTADDWTRPLGERDARELRELYALLGASGSFDAAHFLDHPHNYDRDSRAAVLAFLVETLRPDPLAHGADPLVERAFEPLSTSELAVWGEDPSRPPGFADADGVRNAFLERARGLRARALADPTRHAREARAALEVLTGLDDRATRGPRGATEVVAESAAGAALPWVVLRLAPPADGLGPGEASTAARDALLVGARRGTRERVTVVALPYDFGALADDADPALFAALTERTRDEGVLLLVEAAPPEAVVRSDPRRHGRSAHYSYTYTLTGMADEVRALTRWLDELLRAEVRLVGVGPAGPVALLAAAVALEGPATVEADWSWEFGALESPSDGRLLPGALRYGGLDGFAALIAPTPLTLCGRDALPPFVDAAYRRAGDNAGDNAGDRARADGRSATTLLRTR